MPAIPRQPSGGSVSESEVAGLKMPVQPPLRRCVQPPNNLQPTNQQPFNNGCPAAFSKAAQSCCRRSNNGHNDTLSGTGRARRESTPKPNGPAVSQRRVQRLY